MSILVTASLDPFKNYSHVHTKTLQQNFYNFINCKKTKHYFRADITAVVEASA